MRRRFLYFNGFQVAFQDWSPDGQWLVGMAWRRDKVRDFRGVAYSMEKHEYRELPKPLSGNSVRWLSDSRRLIDIEEDNKLYLFDRTTWKAREIYSFGFDASGIALTKDDRTIYFQRTLDEADIWLAELNNSRLP